jgi:regulator of cell morphogenesis and NO signaling
METTTNTATIGEMVANDFRTAAVFNKYGIDFCCKGNRTIDEACEGKKADKDSLVRELDNLLGGNEKSGAFYKDWPLDKLCDHIVSKHHSYVAERMPMINQFLDKLCKVHGPNHPELFEINDLFKEGTGLLAMHMKKEELVLFPYIRKMIEANRGDSKLEQPHFGKINNPIAMMHQEHEVEGERFSKISQLSNNYTPPEDACNTYKVTYSFLKEFEDDLHLHIHLENNILFPKAIDMERVLVG